MDIMGTAFSLLFGVACILLALLLLFKKENKMLDETIESLRKEIAENARRFRFERRELEGRLNEKQNTR